MLIQCANYEVGDILSLIGGIFFPVKAKDQIALHIKERFLEDIHFLNGSEVAVVGDLGGFSVLPFIIFKHFVELGGDFMFLK